MTELLNQLIKFMVLPQKGSLYNWISLNHQFYHYLSAHVWWNYPLHISHFTHSSVFLGSSTTPYLNLQTSPPSMFVLGSLPNVFALLSFLDFFFPCWFSFPLCMKNVHALAKGRWWFSSLAFSLCCICICSLDKGFFLLLGLCGCCPLLCHKRVPPNHTKLSWDLTIVRFPQNSVGGMLYSHLLSTLLALNMTAVAHRPQQH